MGRLENRAAVRGIAVAVLLFLPLLARADCTGCTTTNAGADVVHVWNDAAACTAGSGNCTFTAPPGVTSIRYLVVGGGGGGGYVTLGNTQGGGGGGAGGYRAGTGQAVTSGTPYEISVGAGGTGGACIVFIIFPICTPATNGGNSSIGALVTAAGGGAGANAGAAGSSGGSGGGGGGGTTGNGGAGNTPSTTPAQGRNGGQGSNNGGAGGGGGAGAVGANGSNNRNGGNGGNGTANNITGSNVTYAGGGGGGGYDSPNASGGNGGQGGGGSAPDSRGSGGDGTNGLGGGGGGATGSNATLGSVESGGNGGSGVVIIRYTPSTGRYAVASGNWSSTGTWSSTGCNGSAGASVPAAGTDVTICNTRTVTLNVTTPVLGDLTIQDTGVLNIGNDGTGRTLNVGGAATNDGTLRFNTNGNHAVNITGAFTNGDTVTAAAVGGTKTLTVSGPLTNSGTIELTGNGVFTLNANSGLTSSGTIRFASGQNHALNVTGAMTSSGIVTSDAVAGARTISVSGLLTTTGTFTFAGTAPMTVNASGGVSNGGTFTVSTASNVTHALNVGGDFTNDGSVNFAPDANSFVDTTFNGTALQTLGGTAADSTFHNLTLSNASGLQLAGSHNAVVTSTLTLSSGRLSTGAGNYVHVTSGNAVAGAGAATFVVGNLRKTYTTGDVTRTFEVGTVTGGVRYTPVSIRLPAVTSAGDITATVTEGDHGSIGSSGLDPGLTINRYWTLSNDSVGFNPHAGSTITFTFISPDDYDPGADFNQFEVEQFDGATWTGYVPSARTATTVTVSGTDINDSELSGAWQIGEPLPPLPAPLAEYRMEEAAWSGATGEVADSSGNDRSGTSFNGANTDDGPPVPIAGDPGTCRYATFDGSNDYFEVADLSDILSGTASLAFWIRTTQSGNDTGWEAPGVTGVEQGGGADDIFWGWLDAAGRIGISVGNDYAADQKSTTSVSDGDWHHVVLTRDAASGATRVYVDGALETSGTSGTGTIGTPFTSFGRIEDTDGTPMYLDGDLDEVRVYDSVLVLSQVQQLMAETHPCVTSGTITVTLSEDADEVNAGAISIANAALGPPEATATGTVTGNAVITTGITTATANAWLMDLVGAGDGGSFTAGAGQAERWDRSRATATGAMSTKPVLVAGSASMTQTHSTTANRLAHALVALAPIAPGNSIAFDAASSADDEDDDVLSWTHTLIASDLTTAKVLVGIAVENEDCNIEVETVFFGSLPLTRAAEAEIDTGNCMRVEIWWGDLTPIIVSTADNSTVGGQAMDQDEAVQYSAVTDSGTLYVDEGIFNANENLDGLSTLSNGNIALSTADSASIGGTGFEDGDIVEVTLDGTFVQLLFDEDEFTGNEDIDAVYVRENGNIILSTTNAANFDPGAGGLAMDDDDLVEWNPNTGTATLFFDLGSVVGNGENVDGVHLLNDDPDLILFSLADNRTLGGTDYEDGDVILYNRNTGAFSLYFSEDYYTSGNEDTNAFTLPRPTIVSAAIAQFGISFATAGSTCAAAEIFIEAQDISGNVLTNYAGTVTLTTSTGHGNWSALDEGGGPGSDPPQGVLTPGANDSGSADYAFAAGDSGTIALFLSNQHAESLTITVFDGTAGVISTSAAALAFSDNAFVLTPVTCTAGTCPSLEVVAGRDHAFDITMVRRDPDTTVCGPATDYDGPKSLKAWVVREGSDPGGLLPALAEQVAALGDGSAPGSDNLQLTFTAGVSGFTLQTADVGRFSISVRDDTGTFAAGNIDGSSSIATVRPFGLGFTNIAGLVPNPGASTPAGAVFTTAGSGFAATVGAYLWQGADDAGNDGVPDTNADVTNNGLTPAYDWATTVTAVLDQPAVVQGGVPGAFQNGSIAGGFSGGSVTIGDFRYFEVGSIRLHAEATGFLGAAGVDVAGDSGVVGRFAADAFDFVVDEAPQLEAACTAGAVDFTYVDQPFDFGNIPQIRARALAADGATVLQNYHDFTGTGGANWWRLDLNDGVSQTYSDPSAPAALILLDTLAAWSPTTGSGTHGEVTFTLAGPFTYDDRGSAPFGPVAPHSADVQLSFTVTDDDGATGILGDPGPYDVAFASPEQRFGRLVIGSAFGSELLPLAVPLRAEYFDGTAFVVNMDDACTGVAATELLLSSAVEAGQTDGDVQVAPGGTTTATVANDPFAAGEGGLSLSAPGEGFTGYADITVDLGALGLDWLRSDQDGDGSPDDDPSGRASFGIYRGTEDFIYIREPWN